MMISKDIHDILFEALYQSLITSEDLELIEKSMVQKTKEEIFEEIVGQGLLSKEQLESLESSESFIFRKISDNTTGRKRQLHGVS